MCAAGLLSQVKSDINSLKVIKKLPNYDSWGARAKLNTQCTIMWALRAQIFVMVSKVGKATQAKNRMNDDFIVRRIWK